MGEGLRQETQPLVSPAILRWPTGMWEGAGEEDPVPSRVRADMVPGARESPNKELSLGRAHRLRGGGSVFPLRKTRKQRNLRRALERHSSSPGSWGRGTGRS